MVSELTDTTWRTLILAPSFSPMTFCWKEIAAYLTMKAQREAAEGRQHEQDEQHQEQPQEQHQEQ